jgi:fatty acid desaturase
MHPMAGEKPERKITWYRSPVGREELAALNQRSDWKGMLQTLGYLGLLVLSGAAVWFAVGRFPLPVVLLLLFIYGTFYAFLLNAFHEFCHKSVFKTRALNTIFLQVVSFLSWSNPVLFWTSHQEHHKYTLHPPDDLEVVLPIKLTLKAFLKSAVVNPWDLYGRVKASIRLSFGRLEGEWENALFTPSAVALRRSLFNWARIHLVVEVLIVIISLYFHLWLVPVLITLAPFYGGWLQYLCNNTQHVGLQDNVPDFRLCTWTVILNPFVRFLYWHMNYHTEHHMYAAVPCYNLGRLHDQIKADLPPSPVGLYAMWKKIIGILKIQEVDTKYQYGAELPAHSSSQ